MKNITTTIILIFIAHIFYGQCSSEAHSNNKQDAWLSCKKKTSPNPVRGNSHWILYDLGYVYRLGATKFWNYNVEGETENGIKNFIIDYSLDGTSWMEAASHQLNQATGDNSYIGENGPDLSQINARYILITAVDTWNNGSCAGLSEVRFDVGDMVLSDVVFAQNTSVKLFPNPANQQLNIKTDFLIRELIIVNQTGHELARSKGISSLDISYLTDGIYFLKIIGEGKKVTTEKFIKQKI